MKSKVILCYCGRLDLTSSNASTYGIFSKLYATHTILGIVVTKMQTAGTKYFKIGRISLAKEGFPFQIHRVKYR